METDGSHTQVEDALPQMKPGLEGLFLLKRVANAYHITGTYYGAFAILDGRLAPLTKKSGFAPEYRNVPAGEGIQPMTDVIREGGAREKSH